MRYFAGRPETELRFHTGENGQAHLREGWLVPEDDGVPARDQESRIELPSPVAAQDFVLSLDVSSCTQAASPSPQRLAVAANGEVLRQAVLSGRQTLHCHLSRQTIEAAGKLVITLLHPDGASTASGDRPLDGRVLSIMLHGLTLTPVGVQAAPSPPLPRPVRRQKGAADLYCPDIWLPPDTALRHVATYHATIMFADRANGVLRHGPPASSPHNVFLATSGARAYLLHAAADCERYTIRICPESDMEADIANASGSEAIVEEFRIVKFLDSQELAFGLSNHSLFLCAEGNGRVTLSRRQPGPWERFELVQAGGCGLPEPGGSKALN